jgi:hypothetical protein
MTTLSSDLSSALWGDYDGASTFPAARPLLAHYTSIRTLEGIASNKEFWFSNPLYMNDLEELKFGMNAGAGEFRTNEGLVRACGSPSAHGKLVKEFNRLFHDFDVNHAFDTYIACFSEHHPDDDDGKLSMWRGYGSGGGGVAVVFDTAKIEALDNSPLIVGKVRYGTQLQRVEIIDKKLAALSSVLQRHSLNDESLAVVAHCWIEWLKEFALFTKHSGFKEEEEWRIVYSSERDRSRALAPMLGYSITQRGVEPKLKLRIGEIPSIMGTQTSLENLVNRIILGPTISTILAANSVRRMLELSGIPSLGERVRESSIPFRP